jgi:hypothetical protein
VAHGPLAHGSYRTLRSRGGVKPSLPMREESHTRSEIPAEMS